MSRDDAPWLAIVGVGADGMDGLGAAARAALERARILAGSARTLALLSPHLRARATAWPSPMMPFVASLLERERGRATAIVASGDPMFYGIGSSIARRIDAREFVVYPQPSSFALACARMGWPQEEALALSVVARPLARVRAALHAGRRIVVLCEDGTTPAQLAATLVDAGCGATAMTAFETLGGPRERRIDATAERWNVARLGDVCVVAMTVTHAANAPLADVGCVPGLPDDAFAHDGALTKRDARAIALARLAPRPGETLWDVGAGAGSIGIEWMRAHPSCRAFAFERDPVRAARIAANARTLGVPDLHVVDGVAPDTFVGRATPHAIFIGGGVAAPGMLDAALGALAPGGRIVANSVTLAGERALLDARATRGGDLVRLAIDRAEPIGAMLAWRPAFPLVQWTYRA